MYHMLHQNSFIFITYVSFIHLYSLKFQLTDILRSLSDSKEQVKRQGDSIEAYEFEQRASRETISRLSGEINKEQELRQAAENSEREIKQVPCFY